MLPIALCSPQSSILHCGKWPEIIHCCEAPVRMKILLSTVVDGPAGEASIERIGKTGSLLRENFKRRQEAHLETLVQSAAYTGEELHAMDASDEAYCSTFGLLGQLTV